MTLPWRPGVTFLVNVVGVPNEQSENLPTSSNWTLRVDKDLSIYIEGIDCHIISGDWWTQSPMRWDDRKRISISQVLHVNAKYARHLFVTAMETLNLGGIYH